MTVAAARGVCEICLEPCRGVRCRRCRNWQRYWDSLTPEQQRAELDAMNRYHGDGEEDE